MITIFSYLAGMSGDFIAYLVHQNPGYLQIDNPKNANNRYVFPSLTLEPLQFDAKIHDLDARTHQDQFLSSVDIDKILKYYNKQHLVIPTHRFIATFDDRLTYVRLFTHNIPIARLSYAMFFLKSHCNLEEPYPSRLEQIKSIDNEIVREQLLTNYAKWKWLAWRYECCDIEKGFDTRYYVRNYFIRYYYIFGHLDSKFRQGYNYIDANELIYKQNTNELCKLLDVDLDKVLLQDYANTNYSLLEKNNIDIHSDKFFDQLHDLVEPELNKTINLYEKIKTRSEPIW